ncbi:uncharacterized protein LOC125768924 [Anopheles funestus]|uniref:uncharacterized protein LOC125768924 n=1 Tax=Anopheles funestus TaxID=62324 RepID=UPI0020C60914|nr:uncharacterized protein LOC125768924 [Anopheles funestus]
MDSTEAEQILQRRREARNRDARSRRQLRRMERLGDVQLAPALLARTTASETVQRSEEVAVEEAGSSVPVILQQSRGLLPSLTTTDARGLLPNLIQQRYSERVRAGTLAPLPGVRRRRGRQPASAIELEQQRQRRQENERARRLRHRQARDMEIEAQPPPLNELPGSGSPERTPVLSTAEEAAVTEEATSGR